MAKKEPEKRNIIALFIRVPDTSTSDTRIRSHPTSGYVHIRHSYTSTYDTRIRSHPAPGPTVPFTLTARTQ